MLLIIGGRLVRLFGAVKPAAIDGVVVGSVTGEMAGAASAGASAQFQKRVRSIFSAEEQCPRTASPSTPRVGRAIVDCGERNDSRWKVSSASCSCAGSIPPI